MSFFIKLLIRTIAISVAAYIVPGVVVENFWVAVVAAIVLGLLNSVLKPILLILTIPINILTLGLFTLVINTFIILLTSNIVSGFSVNSFGAAFIFSIILWLVNWFLESISR